VGEVLGSLRDLAAAGPLVLATVPPTDDRYGRLRVQAFAEVWLQGELLRRGLARVQISPDRPECAADLYRLEREARAAGRGLWDLPAFTPRKAAAVALSDAGTFQIVEGKLLNAASHDGRIFLDFSEDYQRGFSAIVAPEDARRFRRAKLENLTGHSIRLRGTVEEFGGRSEIELSDPAQIEIIE
jgi:hypothetical protein